MEALLAILLPKMLGNGVSYRLHELGGKQTLLRKLESRLKGYASWIPADWRIIIIIDEDREDCRALKQRIAACVANSGLSDKSVVGNGASYHCASRIAVEELEAWIFGDCTALRAAYPRVSANLENTAPFRDPDAVTGGTWEALERVLMRAGYYPGGMPKVEVASSVAQHMSVSRNRSRSFATFRDLVRAL